MESLHPASDDTLIRDFAWRGSLKFLAWVVAPAISCAYLIAMTLGLSSHEGWRVTGVILPFIVLVFGILYPYAALRVLAGFALRHRPSDRPGERLRRILELPWRGTAFTTCVAWTLGGLFFALPVCLWFDKEMVRALLGAIIAFCFGVVMSFPIGLSFEKLLFPLALAEQRAHPEHHPEGHGPFWPRQSWFLPFTFVASIVCTLLLSGCVMVVKMMGLRDTLEAELRHAGVEGAAARLEGLGHAAFSDLLFALLWVAGLVLILPTITTWLLARRQALGTGAVRVAIEGLAAGRTAAPEWISTDELGDLATGMNRVLGKLRQIPRTLQSSAERLGAAGSHLRAANEEQQQSVARQAAALHQAQVTSEEIKRTSQMAAEKAQTVLQVARRAEELGQRGEAAVEQSLLGLSAIRQSVDTIQQRLARLADSTSQVGEITETVKDLADQSNLLAINAAIEAARSGEHGLGFAVVAREIRGMADQSIQATRRIHGILGEITRGIRDAAAMGHQGAQQIEVGLNQMKASGDSLRELSSISQENSSAARQIAGAVTQQHAGFAQIFTAIGDLSSIMDTTLQRIETTQGATATLELVSGEVGQMARQFEVS